MDVGRGDVGDGLADGHPRRRWGVDDGQWSTFAHGHGFAASTVEGGSGDGNIADWDLPGANHLIASDQTADCAITNGNQEFLAANGW